jgi:hypothetical protein
MVESNPGKSKHGAVGGRSSKSNNFIENKNANKRRFEKYERERTKIEEEEEQKWMEEQDRKYAPADKHDIRKIQKQRE